MRSACSGPCRKPASGPMWSWARRWARSMARSWPPTRRAAADGWASCGRAMPCGRRSARRCGAVRPGCCVRARTCIRSSRCATCWTRCFLSATSPIWNCPFTALRPASSAPARAGSAAGLSCPPCWPRVPYQGCCRRLRWTASTTSTAVSSIPSRSGRAVALGAVDVYVLHVGRIESPLTVPRRPWEVGLVAFEIARRHRFHEEMSALPDGVRVHVLPAGRRPASARSVPAPVPRQD